MQAVCVLIVSGSQVLAVSRRGESASWGLPGGKVDPGETLHQACVREVFEETGLVLDLHKLSWIFSREGKDHYVNTYLYPSEGIGEPSQGDAGPVAWVSWDELISGPFGIYNSKLRQAYESWKEE